MPLLTTQHVQKTLSNFTLHLPDVSLSEGQTLCFYGGKDAGKTLLLKLLLGMVTPDQGDISLLGGSPSDLNQKGTAARLGYIGPDANFFLEARLKDLEKTIAPFYPEFDHAYFEKQLRKYNLLITRKLGEFRFYQIKLFEVIITLAHHPRLLLLDDPAFYLPYHDHDHVLELLQNYVAEENAAMLYCTRKVETADKLHSPLYHLENGQVLWQAQEPLASYQHVAGRRDLFPAELLACLCYQREEKGILYALASPDYSFAGSFHPDLSVHKATTAEILSFLEQSEVSHEEHI